MSLAGLYGKPYIDLERHIDLTALDAIHEEVCLALTEVPVEYTGGSHRSMEIMAPSRTAEAYTDYGEVIEGLSPEAYQTFRSLAADPETYPPHQYASTFGEERQYELSRRQMLWLETRHGVYFPWKVYFEMIPNRTWDEKSSPEGKAFTRLARTFFPKTIELVKRLPFLHIGRCNLYGLAPFDHGTVHRDGGPADKPAADHFLTICPGGNKRLFLWDEEEKTELPITSRAYWFNDSDYHGVLADPFFRYSIRVDGVFQPEFLERIQ